MKNLNQFNLAVFFIFIFITTSYSQNSGLSTEKGISKSTSNNNSAIKLPSDINADNFYRKTSIITSEMVEISYFNDKNNLISKRCYSHEGGLDYDENGVAIYEYDYDDQNNVIKIQYYDEFKRPYHINRVGPAAVKKEYDDQSRVIKISYFDAQGNLHTQNSAPIITYSYNDLDQIIEERIFTEKEQLIDYIAPIIRYTYDEENRIKTQSYFDAQEKPVNMMMDNTDETDFTKIVFEYRDGQTISTFYDLKGKEVAPF